MEYSFTVLYTKDTLTDLWTASVIETVAVVAQGKSLDEARENITKAFYEAVLARRRAKAEILSNYVEAHIEKLSIDIEGGLPLPTRN